MTRTKIKNNKIISNITSTKAKKNLRPNCGYWIDVEWDYYYVTDDGPVIVHGSKSFYIEEDCGPVDWPVEEDGPIDEYGGGGGSVSEDEPVDETYDFGASCKAGENLSEICENFISRCRKGSILNEFPGQFLQSTINTVKSGSSAEHKKAWKLLNDGRFDKNK